jgi:hypothetical protein
MRKLEMWHKGGKEEVHTGFGGGGGLKDRDHMEDLGIVGRVMLNAS